MWFQLKFQVEILILIWTHRISNILDVSVVCKFLPVTIANYQGHSKHNRLHLHRNTCRTVALYVIRSFRGHIYTKLVYQIIYCDEKMIEKRSCTGKISTFFQFFLKIQIDDIYKRIIYFFPLFLFFEAFPKLLSITL